MSELTQLPSARAETSVLTKMDHSRACRLGSTGNRKDPSLAVCGGTELRRQAREVQGGGQLQLPEILYSPSAWGRDRLSIHTALTAKFKTI